MRYIRFNNDGWYARYDDGLNETNVVRVADAAAARWADVFGSGTVHIGYDTRGMAPLPPRWGPGASTPVSPTGPAPCPPSISPPAPTQPPSARSCSRQTIAMPTTSVSV